MHVTNARVSSDTSLHNLLFPPMPIKPARQVVIRSGRLSGIRQTLDGVLAGPFASRGFVARTVSLVDMGNLGNQRVIGVRVCEHAADGEKYWFKGD